MPDNKPRSREKHVEGKAKDVYRRGEGLGSGPVGSGSSPRPSSSGQAPQSGPRTRAGGGRSPILLILIVAVLYFVFRGSLDGSEGGGLFSDSESTGSESGYGSLLPSAPTQSPSSSSSGSSAQTASSRSPIPCLPSALIGKGSPSPRL